MCFAMLKFFVHATGKYEQETVMFDFEHNCSHCRRECHNTGCQVSRIARASRDAGCGMYGELAVVTMLLLIIIIMLIIMMSVFIERFSM